jgi:hypothetical protein
MFSYLLIDSINGWAVQYILCDVICTWCTVVLWRKDKRVIAVHVFFILGTTGT